MNMSWSLAVVVVAMLLFAYCAYSVREGSETVDRVLDEGRTAERCYSAGYNAGASGEDREAQPPEDDEGCSDWFESGFRDGRKIYEAYQP